MTEIKIVCGLGNPGIRYEHTRHNLGYDIIDRVAIESGLASPEGVGLFVYHDVRGAAGTVRLIKPLTHVNESGEAVREALNWFNVSPDELFVISDDFHLPLGTLRIRKSGSSGGHNGLQSIIDDIGTRDFARMRVGIGPLPEALADDPGAVPDFVLSRFDPEEDEIVATAISRAVDAVILVIRGELDLAISRYNSTNPTPEA